MTDRQRQEPGYAVLDVTDGCRVVTSAPDLIRLDIDGANRLLAEVGDGPLVEPAPGEVLLDPEGTYRYRLVERDRTRANAGIYARILTRTGHPVADS